MNNYLDEATVAVAAPASASSAATNFKDAVFLESANALKNQARDAVDLQNYGHFDNAILSASSELLALTVTVARMQKPDDIFLFKKGIKRVISDLKHKIAALDYPPSVADKTCFLFCIVIDEQILHSAWGEESSWENQTLVSELFSMRNGGEQFYTVAERALSQPALLIDLLELIYIFLKIGFRGQYRVHGSDKLEELFKRLEKNIFEHREKPELNLFKVPEESKKTFSYKVKKPQRPVKFWRQAFLCFASIALVFVGISYWYQTTLPQKAKDFIQLSDATQVYFNENNGKDIEYTYTSTVEEMANASQLHDINAKATIAEPVSITGDLNTWRLQLATLSSRKSAETFIKELALYNSSAEIVVWRTKFRVVINFSDRNSALSALDKVRKNGIPDAFIVTVK
jgi:type VI secretion system protein ImpK